ncbi:KUP/HAK/KT family potassium transporter [Tabrizicola fusiformis]|uniref:KUP/HAK/KT family potassium transporter n=1 Tax=Tabrizicola sp. SY72 TaxID=2741673 RepID=UPI0015743263|nr:potassium transporter Kup [Tabrizicola sp. SY72]
MTDSDVPDAAHAGAGQHGKSSLGLLTLGCIGVVYGDIGTSPLYAMRESLHAAAHDGLTRDDVIGVISLLIWTLTLIVTLKYVVLIMRADNNGEGGTLSLVALVQQALNKRPGWLLGLGMIGISLFFGDAIITPAMSVLSAVEGMELVAPDFDDYVVPVTLGIIIALFVVQRHGTETVSILFGPIMVVWFLAMGAMGLMHLGDDWTILTALNPVHAGQFLITNGWASLIVLGSVFLAVTGGEALYADMGHFGRLPIRIAWGALVFPALTLSYLGQGALVLADPAKASNPFFLMAPDWGLLPLVILATAATVIASQAVISGAFSMMKQAVRMGLLPRLEILHTSESQYGQIYLPKVNMILCIGVVILVVLFGSSSELASAYGIAVTGDMVITSALAFMLFLRAWKWPLALAIAVVGPLMALELVFLGANALKVFDGGYIPILIASTMVLLMWSWLRGSAHVLTQARRGAVTIEQLAAMLAKSSRLVNVPGTAVFLTSDPEMAPAALTHNIKHNQVLHAQNLIVGVNMVTRPYVEDADRLEITPISDRFTRVDLNFGYMEEPNVPKALALARKKGIKYDIMTTSFFLNRRSFKSASKGGLPLWQENIFRMLSRSAADATHFYRLPTNRVIELGQQLTI